VQAVRVATGRSAARDVLRQGAMPAGHDESWTIPLHILIWTTLSVGLIAVLVVFLLH